MENSFGSSKELGVSSTIEQIKRQEQNEEAKLKAKREFDATKVALERSIRDIISQAKKFQQGQADLLKRIDKFRSELTVHKIRRDALCAQLNASIAELKELKNKADLGVFEVRGLRSDYCKAVQDSSDKCDVWALLMKPTSTEPLPRTLIQNSEENEQTLLHEDTLKTAMERRENAIEERDRLLAEPDTGDEFVRIKNALRYSLEMSANLRK